MTSSRDSLVDPVHCIVAPCSSGLARAWHTLLGVAASWGALAPTRWRRHFAALVTGALFAHQAPSQCPDQWLPSGGFNVAGYGFSGPHVQALVTMANGDVVAGGAFVIPGSLVYIARWDGVNWSALGSGTNDYVNCLVVQPGGSLVAGGRFTTAGGAAATRIARWNGSSWSSLGTGMAGGASPQVSALAVMPNGDLIAGGTFTTAGGVLANNIARWNGTSWSALGPGGGGTNGWVRALAVTTGGDLIVGGAFTTAGGGVANRVARWDGSAWSNLDTGMDGTVNSLAVLPGGDIVAGGFFWYASNTLVSTIARWGGAQWSAMGSGMLWPFPYSPRVDTLMVRGNGDLIAGGQFSTAGGVACSNIARWSGAAWSPLAGSEGVIANCLALTEGSGTLFAGGGGLNIIGGGVSRWGCAASLATTTSYGIGCYERYQAFYENFTTSTTFDLANSTLRLTPRGPGAPEGYVVSWIPGPPSFFTPVSPDLGLGDDQLSPSFTLPFPFPHPPFVTTDILVSSNGLVGLGGGAIPIVAAAFYGSISPFLFSECHAPMYGDHDPLTGSGAGTIHIDVDPSNQAVYVTWMGVQQYGAPGTTSTFQVMLSSSGLVEYRYRACAVSAMQVLTGLGKDVQGPILNPGSRDLTLTTPFETWWPEEQGLLHSASRPNLGQNVTLQTSQLPAACILGGTALSFQQYDPGIDLGSLGMPDCRQYVGADQFNVFLPNSGIGTFTFGIPNVPAFLGANVYTQGFALSPASNPLGATSSNGMRLTLGLP